MKECSFDARKEALYPRPVALREGPMTVFVYINTAKQPGDVDYVKVFANVEAAERWFEEHDPEGVAFKYDVLE